MGKLENGTLIKHKARLVARGLTQISGIDYHGAYLYAPVVRLEYILSIFHLTRHVIQPRNPSIRCFSSLITWGHR